MMEGVPSYEWVKLIQRGTKEVVRNVRVVSKYGEVELVRSESAPTLNSGVLGMLQSNKGGALWLRRRNSR
jgi:hypothetical protein